MGELLAELDVSVDHTSLWFWISDSEFVLAEFNLERRRGDDSRRTDAFIVHESLDPSRVRVADVEDDPPLPVFVPFQGSTEDIEAAAAELREQLPYDDLDNFGISTDWRAQMFHGQRPTELYVQEFATGDYFVLDLPEIAEVAGDEFMSVYVAQE
jgi:hypothetical protein